jgi:hypothetical protein
MKRLLLLSVPMVFVPSRLLRLAWTALALAFVLLLASAISVPAQESAVGNGSDITNPAEMPSLSPSPEDANVPAPVPRIPMTQPITGSMMVSPPYGIAPLKVGFLVQAADPENIGFLTYQWNFGDGTVSSLPPETYIFHTYKAPGNYLCTLILKTADGRSKTLFQGVLVRSRGD